MKIFNLAVRLFIFSVLTIITQIGGAVYLLNFATYGFIDRKVSGKWMRRLSKSGSFAILYSLVSFMIVPLIARPLGRVPLPVSATENLQPLNVWTFLLNRNYVKPELRDAAFQVAAGMDKKYPGTKVNYLDANFPLFDNFPLLPHLSHNDGKKLDLSFCYNDKSTGQPTNEAPSFIGYGIFEEPAQGEINTARDCEQRGYRQYSLLKKITPQGAKDRFVVNEQKTRDLVEFFAREEVIGKIFIEPHLKKRLGLDSPKVRFHGCQAVRHDDHIHVQLK